MQRFDLEPGTVLGGRWIVRCRLGAGWESEVYEVAEKGTGVTRAAKVFLPHRNPEGRARRRQAQKMHALRDCSVLVKYLHSEHVDIGERTVTVLFSELFEGERLDDLVRSRPGKRMQPFEAMHMLHALAAGLEPVHARRQYHGDVHSENVLVRRRGIFFDVRLIDTFDWGAASAEHVREDVVQLVQLFHEMLGGARTYRTQPPEVKRIVAGQKRGLIMKRFPTAGRLRKHLETFCWEDQPGR